MIPVLAHIGHWTNAVVYLVPVVVVLAIMWWGSRKAP